jgi:hypothetical protein
VGGCARGSRSWSTSPSPLPPARGRARHRVVIVDVATDNQRQIERHAPLLRESPQTGREHTRVRNTTRPAVDENRPWRVRRPEMDQETIALLRLESLERKDRHLTCPPPSANLRCLRTLPEYNNKGGRRRRRGHRTAAVGQAQSAGEPRRNGRRSSTHLCEIGKLSRCLLLTSCVGAPTALGREAAVGSISGSPGRRWRGRGCARV